MGLFSFADRFIDDEVTWKNCPRHQHIELVSMFKWNAIQKETLNERIIIGFEIPVMSPYRGFKNLSKKKKEQQKEHYPPWNSHST